MITILRSLALTVVLSLLALTASAQTLLNNTTLSAAMTNSQTFATVASISTITLNDIFYVDNEAMCVTATPTSGTLRVSLRRGCGDGQGGIAMAHASGNVVYTGAPGLRWKQVDPDWSATCIRGQQLYLPWINVTKGVTWGCGALGQSATASLTWNAHSAILVFTYNSPILGRFEGVPDPWFRLEGVLAKLSILNAWLTPAS